MKLFLAKLSGIIESILEGVLTNIEDGYFLSKDDCRLLLMKSDFDEISTLFNFTTQSYPLSPLYFAVAVEIQKWIHTGNCPVLTAQEFALLDESCSDDSKLKMLVRAEPLIQHIKDNWESMTFPLKSSSVSDLLEALGKRGLLYLLGVRHTVGSIDVFPPPLSALIHSFNLRHNQKSKLTVGARALSKHCHRDVSSSWWGVCKGTEEAKNDHANNVIRKILSSSAWLNIHMLPHEVMVLEVRHAEGYGARWSADGSHFRGFLEPQMEEGHTCKWRH